MSDKKIIIVLFFIILVMLVLVSFKLHNLQEMPACELCEKEYDMICSQRLYHGQDLLVHVNTSINKGGLYNAEKSD